MQGEVSYYSIDPLVESVFASCTIDDLILVTAANPKNVMSHSYSSMISNVSQTMIERGIDNFSVVIPTPCKGIQYTTEIAVVAIPNEHQRLLDRIQELESQLAARQRFDIKFHD